MSKIFYVISILFFIGMNSFAAQGSTVVINNVVAGSLKSQVDSKGVVYTDILSLTITDGSMNATDFGFIRNNLINLTSVELSGNLSTPENKIPNSAFLSFSKLNSFKCTSLKISSIGDDAFKSCAKLVSLSLQNIKSIEARAFQSCTSLTLVSLPEVQTIESWAFGLNSGITDIVLPKVETIGDNSFYNCVNLRAVILPKALSIGEGAFHNCADIVSVNLPLATTISGSAFHSCTNLTSLFLPKVSLVGDGAFYNCGDLTSVNLPQTESIGASAFYSCRALKTATLPSVTLIQDNAFEGCSSLINVSLPSVVTIRNRVFGLCSSLTEISLPKAETIGESVFGCAKLTKASLPSAISIGTSAFSGCGALTSVFLPNAISIGGTAFSYCTALKDISLPSAISIGGETFSNCTNLLAVGLPSVMTIGDAAFRDCKVLKTIVLGENEPYFGIGIYNVTTNKPIILTPAASWSKNNVQGIPVIFNSHLAAPRKVAAASKISLTNTIPSTSNYIWYRDDVKISENSNTYTLVSVQQSDSGQYNMSFVYNNDGIVRVLPKIMLEVGSGYPTNLDNIKAAFNVNLYPNPVENELKIESDGKLIKSIQVLDTSGKLIGQYDYLTGRPSVAIPSSAWNKGLYLVSIKTENQMLVRKVIKK